MRGQPVTAPLPGLAGALVSSSPPCAAPEDPQDIAIAAPRPTMLRGDPDRVPRPGGALLHEPAHGGRPHLSAGAVALAR